MSDPQQNANKPNKEERTDKDATPPISASAEANSQEDSNQPSTDASSKSSEQEESKTELLQAAGIVGFFTIGSRILGLVRDYLMAGLFGATYINDAFQLAFILPNLTRRLFGEGALSSAFVPVFSERLVKGKREEANKTASVILTRLATGLLLVCLLLLGISLAARNFMELPEHLDLTLRLSEIMIGYCVLINIAAVLMGILNALKHFAAPACAPLFLNICMIAACLYGGSFLKDLTGNQLTEGKITIVALSVMAGGLIQLLVMIPPALFRGFRYRPSLSRKDEGYQEVMKSFGPVILGVALFQINVLLDQLIARFLIFENGPVTMLAYGNRLIQLPWAIFSLALATAALPMLSRFWASNNKEAFTDSVHTALRNTIFLAAPSAVGLCLLSTDLVRLLYGTGEFLASDADAVIRTGRVVNYLALGLCFYSVNSILVRALYATKDTRTPTRSAFIAVGVNLTLNLILVLGTDMKEAGLALASAISGACQTVYLIRGLLIKIGSPDSNRLNSFITTVGGSALIGGVGAILIHQKYGASQDIEGFLSYAIAGAFALLPVLFAGRTFFAKHCAPFLPKKGGTEKKNEERTYEDWKKLNLPRDLIFYYSIYTTTLVCIVMGMLVWAVRDSLPPGEGSQALVFQRAVVPVALGFAIFVVAAGTFQSHEYEEIKSAFARKLGKKKA